jgi:hypothetical protein
VPWHFGLHAAPNGAGMWGVMPSYKHIAPPEQRPGVTERLFVQRPGVTDRLFVQSRPTFLIKLGAPEERNVRMVCSVCMPLCRSQ